MEWKSKRGYHSNSNREDVLIIQRPKGTISGNLTKYPVCLIANAYVVDGGQ